MNLRSAAVLALTLSVVTLAACGAADDTPPAASVTVNAARTRVPIGGPLQLTYRFELTGAPVASDYAVFVHLTNADGQVLWTDDHEPPVPTSNWRAGTPIEYTRTLFLPPATLHPGDVGVDVGLYREGDRLPLAGAPPSGNPAARAYRVADLQLAPESENVFLIYQDGWHQDEFSTAEPTRSWRWSQKTATVAFRHPRADVEMLIEYGGRPDFFGDMPQQVTLIGSAGDAIATFPIDSADPTLRRIRITSAQMGTGDLAELRFDVDRTFVPAEQPASGADVRELGLRVYNIYIDVP